MAAKTWDTDFRYPAIQESIKHIRSESAGDIFRSRSSFCIPVANKPIVGWTPGRLFIVFLVLGFVLLIAAAIILGGAGVIASLMPAARASRVHVLEALRSE